MKIGPLPEKGLRRRNHANEGKQSPKKRETTFPAPENEIIKPVAHPSG